MDCVAEEGVVGKGPQNGTQLLLLSLACCAGPGWVDGPIITTQSSQIAKALNENKQIIDRKGPNENDIKNKWRGKREGEKPDRKHLQRPIAG